eukprot:8108104-Pyramimonas_sp.AAC.1
MPGLARLPCQSTAAPTRNSKLRWACAWARTCPAARDMPAQAPRRERVRGSAGLEGAVCAVLRCGRMATTATTLATLC